MSAALFDLALRVAARDHGGPVPRLLHNPAPAREVKVAVAARRTGPVVHVQAVRTGRSQRERKRRARVGGDISRCGMRWRRPRYR